MWPLKLDKTVIDARARVAFQVIEKWAQQIISTAGSFLLTVKESDGTPSVASVTTIAIASPGTVTDNGGGQVTITPIPAGTAPCMLVKHMTGDWTTVTPADPTNKDYVVLFDHTTGTWKAVEITTTFTCPP